MEAARMSGLYCIAVILHIYYIIFFLFFQRIIFGRWSIFIGAPLESRTPDTLIKSQVLCHLS